MFERWKESIVVNGIEKHVEIRWDEIFERYCRIIDRVGLESVVIEDFSDKIGEDCIFCHPEKVAKFDERFENIPTENKYAFIFPNINPYAKYSSVCAFKKHFIRLHEFTPEIIKANLELSIKYIKKAREMGDARYASINWNYLMPAGASILHPHMQTIVDRFPTSYMKKISRNEKFYEYIPKEIKSERYIGRIKNVHLFVPFAPFGFNEVFGFIDKNLEDSIDDISIAVSTVLSYYENISRNSFNFSLYYSFDDEFPLHFRMITRQNMAKYYRNDAMFFERLHFETILERKPEEIAKEIREKII